MLLLVTRGLAMVPSALRFVGSTATGTLENTVNAVIYRTGARPEHGSVRPEPCSGRTRPCTVRQRRYSVRQNPFLCTPILCGKPRALFVRAEPCLCAGNALFCVPSALSCAPRALSCAPKTSFRVPRALFGAPRALHCAPRDRTALCK